MACASPVKGRRVNHRSFFNIVAELMAGQHGNDLIELMLVVKVTVIFDENILDACDILRAVHENFVFSALNIELEEIRPPFP